jgi:hypothetical protein
MSRRRIAFSLRPVDRRRCRFSRDAGVVDAPILAGDAGNFRRDHRQRADFLQHAIFEQLEILDGEVRDRSALPVPHDDVDDDGGRRNAEGRTGRRLRLWSGRQCQEDADSDRGESRHG